MRRSARSRPRSAARARRSGTGYAKLNATRACGPGRPRTSASGSRRWSGRTANSGRPTRSCEGERLFCPGGARPPVPVMIAFIDDHCDAYGVEPICRVLPIAPSTYYAHAARRADPDRLPARAKRDAALMAEIRRGEEANFCVYGVRKVWRQLAREGIVAARCTVARAMGLQGAVRGKKLRTPVPDPAAACPLDRINRQFKAPRPNMLWVSDFTYVATWRGDLVGLRLRRLRDRCLRPAHRWLACVALGPGGFHPRCLGTGSSSAPPLRRQWARVPFGQRVAIREHSLHRAAG